MTPQSILIVDDNPLNLKLVRILLTGEGHDVRSAETADEALAELEDFTPRLILLDLQLPGMDGLELARQIKSRPALRDTRIVALTAYAMEADRQRALDAGCDGYVTKPIDTRKFANLVAGFLQEPPPRGDCS